MIFLSGYSIAGLLYESRQSRIYRGRRLADDVPVIFKVMNEDFPSPEKRARFQQEYDLMRKLHADGILAAYSMECHHKMQVMIVEDFGGTSLNNLNLNAALPLAEWLQLAVHITAGLAQLHGRHIMHKDINPANVVWNRRSGQVKLIDLGIATELTREVPEVRNPDRLEGTLSYISPEQTGRMNRAIDYRTDFYSLGVMFYEMLSGQLPFVSGDALELVHAHIARVPAPIEQLRPGIAPMVSAIIAKLMGKTAEERYQSAAGLQADLQTCLDTLSDSGVIAPFPLSRHDFSGRLQISQKLYGRETQIATLLEVFDRASRGPAELLLVAGYSGVGKSALVHEIQKPITQNRGIFIEGKFDQFKRDIPYASVSQAFKELIQQLLTRGDAVVALWKERILDALGNNAQVIINVIPTLELLIGAQPAVLELPAAQAQNRFNQEFRNFVGTFASAEHPLVLFLDDLQWADLPSLQLMSLLLRAPAMPHLLLIGAYRDNEITPAHALRLTLDELEKNGVAVHTVTLPPLSLKEVNHLLCDTLHASPAQIDELAQLCLAKTEGNPFFLNQFLAALVDQMIVRPDPTQGGWLWDIGNVRKAGITDNIVELMVAKLHKLPLTTQQVLQGAACLGNTFDLHMLAAVCGLAEAETARRLWEALQEEVIIPLDDHYRYADQSASAGESSLLPRYRFLHDRVHQAANLLSSDAEKAAMHLAIGRLWLATYSQVEQQDLLFDLANHLNLGRGLMTDHVERSHLAHLNLTAARRAKASVAYKPALMYLETALKLLDETDWQSQYDLMFALHLEAAEAAYLSADPVQLEQYITSALRHAATLLDQVKLHAICIQAYISESKFLDALRHGLKTLELLGRPLPKKPTRSHTSESMKQMELALAGRKIGSLLDLPDRTDPHQLAVGEILLITCAAAYYAMPRYVPILLFTGIQLALRYGNSPANTSTYSLYGVVLIGRPDKIEEGLQYGDVALKLLERAEMSLFKCRAMWIVHGLVRPWKFPLCDTLEALHQGYLGGRELGELEFAANHAMLFSYYSFYCGNSLAELEKQTADYCSAIAQMQRPAVFNAVRILWQCLHNLRGKAPDPKILEGDICNKTQMHDLELRDDDRTLMCKLFGTKLFLSYLFRDYRQALLNSVLAERYIDPISGFFGIGVFCFYDSLIRLALLREAPSVDRRSMLCKIAKNQKKLRHWAQHAPENFLHKCHLIEAEQARRLGQIAKANRAYEQAIRLAGESNFLHEEALAKELAGEHYLEQGIESVAMTYLRDAQHGYRRWGAVAKVRDMDARYPQWLGEQAPTAHASFARATETVSMTNASTSGMLDFASVMKASQALSQEIVLAPLLKRLMQVVMESAGAQRGVLLLKKDQDWFLEAEKSDGQADATVLQSVALDALPQDDTPLPLSLVHYIARTKESIVIHEALKEKLVAGDPYVQRHRPRSLLTLPILHHGELTGMLYLENNAVSGAFTEGRLEVLHLLASQAAISIENARLYADMEERVAARTAELKTLSLRDELTGVANRRAFDERLQAELGRGRRNRKPVSLLIIDIDHFKRVNDTFGHPVGDACLRQMGAALNAQCQRSADFVARYGGEEFAMILPDTDMSQAMAFAEHVRGAVAQIVMQIGEIRHPITASIGVASDLGNAHASMAELIASADRGLYAAKAAGRNCVIADIQQIEVTT
ncbi:MAG: diguanylate cyclase [Herminiimonas sp.]|nr:diguanylate cyclase [Herminiimonas sp.]